MRRGVAEHEGEPFKEIAVPTDTTPDPRDMERLPESQQIPQARRAGRDKDAPPDISHRPGLPDRPLITAADIEDEEADPVIDSGPGIADGEDRPSRGDGELNRR
jgi:hypothetical protein